MSAEKKTKPQTPVNQEPVLSVPENTGEVKQAHVQDVIDKHIARRKKEDAELTQRIKDIRKDFGKKTQKKDGNGSTTGKANQDSLSQQNSGSLELPKSDLKLRWKQPRTVRQFASQVNAVATKVLNGEIDMDSARVYASLTRVLAQAASIQVTKSRFLKQTPDLTIDDNMTEGDE